MNNERGELLTLALIAFGVFLVVMAVGNVVDRVINPPCDPKTQHCISYGSGSVEAPK
jgi:hypothetical protein